MLGEWLGEGAETVVDGVSCWAVWFLPLGEVMFTVGG